MGRSVFCWFNFFGPTMLHWSNFLDFYASYMFRGLGDVIWITLRFGDEGFQLVDTTYAHDISNYQSKSSIAKYSSRWLHLWKSSNKGGFLVSKTLDTWFPKDHLSFTVVCDSLYYFYSISIDCDQQGMNIVW